MTIVPGWLIERHRSLGAGRRAYQEHTKRDAPDRHSLEEATLFFEVDGSGRAIPPRAGRLHAVLPTKIASGVAAHLQASWLLSVDRQTLQSLTENKWNAAILRQ